METAIKVTLFLHLLGMASLVGGSLAQVKHKTKSVTSLMRDGALTQLITGFILIGLIQSNDEELNMGIVSVKITLLAFILTIIYLGRNKLSNKSYLLILGLSIINVGLALFVTSAS